MTTQTPTADETRDRILTEAERLFRHYGYGKTTVADIASACTMSPANVYRFFASKLAINEAICTRVITASESRLRHIARSPAPAAERLRAFITEMNQFTIENLLDQKKVHEMVVVAMEEQWGAIRDHIERVSTILAEIITSGIEAGEFPPQDAVLATRCVHNAIIGLKHPVIVAQCMDDPNTVKPDEMVDFVLKALRG